MKIVYNFQSTNTQEIEVSDRLFAESEKLRLYEENYDRKERYHNYSLDLWQEKGQADKQGHTLGKIFDSYAEDDYIPSDAVSWFASMLEAMPESHKTRLFLYAQDGNVENIAKSEGITSAAVYKSIGKARKYITDETEKYIKANELEYSPSQFLRLVMYKNHTIS